MKRLVILKCKKQFSKMMGVKILEAKVRKFCFKHFPPTQQTLKCQINMICQTFFITKLIIVGCIHTMSQNNYRSMCDLQ